jgi:hypothetical protein
VLRVTQDVKLVNSKIGTIDIDPEEKLSVNTADLQQAASMVDETIARLEEGVSQVIIKNESIEVRSYISECSEPILNMKFTAERQYRNRW